MGLRVAFTGASGTGKTTLATVVAEKLGLELCPVGSRSVANEMGFATPYEVDKAGKRAEFQRLLLSEKVGWELAHDSFVTDRTVVDNLAYCIMHCPAEIGQDMVDLTYAHSELYSQIYLCRVEDFCDLASDPARKQNMTYQHLYELVLGGIYDQLLFERGVMPMMVLGENREARINSVLHDLEVAHTLEVN